MQEYSHASKTVHFIISRHHLPAWGAREVRSPTLQRSSLWPQTPADLIGHFSMAGSDKHLFHAAHSQSRSQTTWNKLWVDRKPMAISLEPRTPFGWGCLRHHLCRKRKKCSKMMGLYQKETRNSLKWLCWPNLMGNRIFTWRQSNTQKLTN